MKYSFMSFSTPSLDLAETLEVARRYGYDGIEPRLDSRHAHGVEVDTTATERKSIRDQVADSSIQLACLATDLSYADPARTVEMVRQTHERIDLAGDLEVPVIRVFGGSIPAGIDREEAIELLVQSLAKVADHAAERGLTLCLETHDSWCDAAHVATVLQRVDHAAIGANWDIMHPVLAAHLTIDKAFDLLKPWIRHVHFHDGQTQGDGSLALSPAGDGEIDHRRTVEVLSAGNYDGFLSGEWIGWEPYDVHLPRELATMKRYEQEMS